MSVATAQSAVPEVRHPFGLPMGTIRGTLALLICGFVWLVLLWPTETKLPLAHFFLGSMVFMAFVSHPTLPTGAGKSVAPWVLRVLFAGGSIGVVAFAVYTDWESVTKRLVPDVDEFRAWWLMFLGVTVGGFLVGRLLRLVFRSTSPFFQSLQAWLSVLAMLMIVGEYLLFIAFNTASSKPDAFMHAWHGVELAAVSAYFGSRA